MAHILSGGVRINNWTTTLQTEHFALLLALKCGSVIIMALHHGMKQFDLEELLTLSVGAPMLLAWAVIAYLGLRLESNYFFTVAVMLSPGHVAFILLALTQTALSKEENLIAECRYAASAGSLIVHIVLIYLMVRCYRNFGLGLKEKVYPRQTTTTGVQSSLVQ
ncbi:uncharacterized protein [Procambarus clarkii]|uniref:uncharacterized protein isoform X1 n=2 Tax=Procambarus clarkii TaxID=6728 RepID=UPI0037443EF5